jgi:LPS-assembly lipoprotein
MLAPLRYVLVVLVALGLVGCGFQLRGTDLRSSVARVYVDAAPRHGFETPMRLALERAGVEVLELPAADGLVVDLIDERRDRRSISVSETAVAAEYEVIVGVRYGVRDGAGRQLIEPQWLARERVYRVDRDNILGSSEERALLESEMQSELIQQIIRSLDALAGAGHGT